MAISSITILQGARLSRNHLKTHHPRDRVGKMYFIKSNLKFTLILVLLLSSCSVSKTQYTNTEPTATYAVVHIATTIPEPFSFPEGTNDGQLALSIKIYDKKDRCYSSNEVIPISLEYKNLKADKLLIADYDAIAIHPLIGAKAQLYPFVYNENNQEVFTPEHLMLDQFAYMQETKVHLLESGETFNILTETYSFPSMIIGVSATGESQNIPIPSGVYFLQFKYVNIGNTDYWEGVISSNVIEICIKQN
jgi:hypothetical protein